MTEYKAIKVNGKKVDEHRYVMEQYLGRKLTRNEVVHHKNGDKRDNRIENLEILTRSSHATLHLTGREPSAETKEKLRKATLGNKYHSYFSEEQVREIRELRKSGMEAKEIAQLNDVTASAIYRIVSGKRYAWIK